MEIDIGVIHLDKVINKVITLVGCVKLALAQPRFNLNYMWINSKSNLLHVNLNKSDPNSDF